MGARIELPAKGESYIQTGTTSGVGAVVLAESLGVSLNSFIGFEITLVGVQTAGIAGTIGDGYHHKFIGSIKREAGSAAIVGLVTEIETGGDSLAFDPPATTITAISYSIGITVNGELDKDFTWKSEMRFTDISY